MRVRRGAARTHWAGAGHPGRAPARLVTAHKSRSPGHRPDTRNRDGTLWEPDRDLTKPDKRNSNESGNKIADRSTVMCLGPVALYWNQDKKCYWSAPKSKQKYCPCPHPAAPRHPYRGRTEGGAGKGTKPPSPWSATLNASVKVPLTMGKKVL